MCQSPKKAAGVPFPAARVTQFSKQAGALKMKNSNGRLQSSEDRECQSPLGLWLRREPAREFWEEADWKERRVCNAFVGIFKLARGSWETWMLQNEEKEIEQMIRSEVKFFGQADR